MAPYTLFKSFLLAILVLLYSLAAMAGNIEDQQKEYKLKAAFLLNFSKFTTWPKDVSSQSGSEFVFCIVGEDPFGAALDGLVSKTVGGRKVRLLYAESIVEPPSCHVMFVSKSEENNLEYLENINDGGPVLTVSDIKGFSKQGGIFEFMTRAGRLSFIVNNRQATQNGLQVSASLLNLAVEVL